MPPLGWTKKEAEKRGELGKGRPRAVELRDSVAALAPFEYAEEEEEGTAPPASPAGEAEQRQGTPSGPATSEDAPEASPAPESRAHTPGLRPPARPKIWLRTANGGGIQLCGSLRQFCTQQGLNYEQMLAVLNEEAEEHQGWRAGRGLLPPPQERRGRAVASQARAAAQPY